MKILAIRIKNLASLEGVFEIDFLKEPLLSSGIFAITGPTGAGKSTLLDALCLALFARTPRHVQAKETGIEIPDGPNNKIAPGDVRGILRKGTAEGYSEVGFVGVDGVKYRATWSVRRARNKAEGSFQPDTLELVNIDSKEKIAGKKTEILKRIEQLAGLNFEQFTRSVLLAQGDFTAFLKAEKKEKSSLLEKLTGTDVYSEISKNIFQKNKSAEQELKDLHRQMEGVTLLTTEDISLLKEQQGVFAEKILGLEGDAAFLSTAVAWHHKLSDLATGKENSENYLRDAISKKENDSERIVAFALVESVQGARGIVESKEEAQNELGRKNKELDALLNNAGALQMQLKNSANELEQATEKLTKKQKEYEEAQPDIANGRVLDSLLLNKREQFNAAEQEVKTATLKKSECQEVVNSKEKEIEKLTFSVNELSAWKNKNESKRGVAENINLIVSKLADAAKLIGRQQKVNKDIAANKNKASENKEQFVLLGTTLADKNNLLQQLSEHLRQRIIERDAYDIAEIKRSEATFFQLHANMIAARGCRELLDATQQEQEKYQAKVSECSAGLGHTTAELRARKEDLNVAGIKKEQTGKLLSRAQLETAKDVKEMRSQLTDGMACPVCGSEHHPYKESTDIGHRIIDDLKKEYTGCEKTYADLLKLCGSLEKHCDTLTKDKELFEKEAASKLTEVNRLHDRWQCLDVDTACMQLAATERMAWLDTQISGLRQHLEKAQEKAAAFEKLGKNIERQKDDTQKLEKECDVFAEQQRNNRREQHILELEQGRLAEALKDCIAQNEEVVCVLDPYFTLPEWRNNWQKEPSVFESRLKTFAKDWNEKINLLDERSLQVGRLSAELSGLKKHLDGFEENENEAIKKHGTIMQELQSLQAGRELIFGGKGILAVEQDFKKAIAASEQAVKDCRNSYEDVNGACNVAQGNMEQLKINISAIAAKGEDCKARLVFWLSEFNTRAPLTQLGEENLAALLSHGPAWIEGERKWLRGIEDDIKTAEATWKERSEKLWEHEANKPSLHTKEEAGTLLEAVRMEIEELYKARTELEFKVRQDIENQKQAGKIDAEIKSRQVYFDNWQKLDELLGSATGEKFRQIAQEYTLDILLGFANIHLAVLAGRYKLGRIPGTLALQVIDRDMGDEIRSVHSLSGGESFLVSLALALGLASLSSNRMKVESLFIDEGFGSLDAETLGVAMDALERLHNQGRKVGVISHVREMTERINTQIKVVKLSNARSRIEVVG
jgi:exonuclease SbcC